MRSFYLLAAAIALASCSTTISDAPRTARAEAQLQRLIAGKVAGPTVSCISDLRSNMTVIDDGLIAFKQGSKVYTNDFRGGNCSPLGSGFYVLLTRSGGSGLCSGDIADVIDTTSGMTVGSCALGEFTPYTGARASRS